MSRTLSFVRRALVLVAIVALVSPTAAEQLFRRGVRYKAFTDPAGRFAVQVPDNWLAVTGTGRIAVTFAEKGGDAAIVIERVSMNTPLAARDITELFAEVETQILREEQPTVANVVAALAELSGQPAAVIDYTRQGIASPERVRQYSFPAETLLFRVTCSAPVPRFTRYEEVCTRVGQSFVSLKADVQPQN